MARDNHRDVLLSRQCGEDRKLFGELPVGFHDVCIHFLGLLLVRICILQSVEGGQGIHDHEVRALQFADHFPLFSEIRRFEQIDLPKNELVVRHQLLEPFEGKASLGVDVRDRSLVNINAIESSEQAEVGLPCPGCTKEIGDCFWFHILQQSVERWWERDHTSHGKGDLKLEAIGVVQVVHHLSVESVGCRIHTESVPFPFKHGFPSLIWWNFFLCTTNKLSQIL